MLLQKTYQHMTRTRGREDVSLKYNLTFHYLPLEDRVVGTLEDIQDKMKENLELILMSLFDNDQCASCIHLLSVP